MITNDFVLMELNRQRRAHVAATVAALRVNNDRRRPLGSLWDRRRRAATAQPITTAFAATAPAR